MSGVIFARPRWNYDSYQDLYSLIALSGYPLVYFDEIDPASDNCYVMTIRNGENENGWSGDVRARIVLYDLEWRLDGQDKPISGVAEVWAADQWYARQIGARYVMLGSHPGLHPWSSDTADKAIDVTMLAYMGPWRRQVIYGQLAAHGLVLGRNGWGEERARTLMQTRAMLHVHQHDHVATIAPQRFALAAAYRLPLISETVCEPGVFKDAVLWSDYNALAQFTAEKVHDSGLTVYGEALHQLLCVERTFRKCIDEAL